MGVVPQLPHSVVASSDAGASPLRPASAIGQGLLRTRARTRRALSVIEHPSAGIGSAQEGLRTATCTMSPKCRATFFDESHSQCCLGPNLMSPCVTSGGKAWWWRRGASPRAAGSGVRDLSHERATQACSGVRVVARAACWHGPAGNRRTTWTRRVVARARPRTPGAVVAPPPPASRRARHN